VNQETSVSKELDAVLEGYLAVEPPYVSGLIVLCDMG
jgi:hypothetical protein